MTIKDIIKRLKVETDNNEDIIYRYKRIHNNDIFILFNEPLTSSDKISDFIVRSLNKIDNKHNIYESIKNNISNFKYSEINSYEDLVFYLNRGFTIILVEGVSNYLALETKGLINRSISNPTTEATIRGSKDSFVEDIQINTGLIKKRIKTNDLWKKDYYIGNLTKTKVSVLSINNIVDNNMLKEVCEKIERIDIDGLIDGESLKAYIGHNNQALPTVLTTERPDVTCNLLIEGRIIILVDNTCFALILPAVLNDYIKTAEDYYGKSINVSLTRIIKYIAFFLAAIFPGLYVAITTYNQEIIPTDLLVNFATQRSGVPFPVFVEAFIMIFAFELIREADLRVPTNAGGALSIVGALILGEAAVNAGLVSPIMIIVTATTAICSLPFSELEFINALRIYRIAFMIGGTTLGIIGIVFVFIVVLINLLSITSSNVPYLMPFIPFDKLGIKDSIIKMKNKIIHKNYIDKEYKYEK